MDILKEFYILRLNMYQKRKEYLEGMLEAEAQKLSDQARFIVEKCSGELVVENKKRKTIVDELIKNGYQPDPVLVWKEKVKLQDDDEASEEDTPDDEDEEGSASTSKKKPIDPGTYLFCSSETPLMFILFAEKEFQNLSDVKKFDYLLGMSMWMLTDEKKNELLRQKDVKLAELATLRAKTNKDLWREDLDVFIEKLDAVEEKERRDESYVKKESKKTVAVSFVKFPPKFIS